MVPASGCACACTCVLSRVRLCAARGLQPVRLLCPWDFAGKNPGVSCYFLLQGSFLTQGLNPHLLYYLLCSQVDSLPLVPSGKPKFKMTGNIILINNREKQVASQGGKNEKSVVVQSASLHPFSNFRAKQKLVIWEGGQKRMRSFLDGQRNTATWLKLTTNNQVFWQQGLVP